MSTDTLLKLKKIIFFPIAVIQTFLAVKKRYLKKKIFKQNIPFFDVY
jgi:hypothetical protein